MELNTHTLQLIMKKSYTLLALLLIAGADMKAQFILAGENGVKDYDYNYVPDKLLQGTPSPNFHIDSLLVDMNNDNINDFKIASINDDGGNWHHYFYSTITPLNNNLIAISGFDSCFATCPPPSYIYRIPMADSLSFNDTINSNKIWIDSLAYLTWDGWNASYPNGCGYSCHHHTFSSSSKYLGVAVSVPTGTLFGWIKIKGVNFETIVVEEYACNLVATNIESYVAKRMFSISPNPSSGIFIFESTFYAGVQLVLYNSLGSKIAEYKNVQGKKEIDLSGQSAGIYFLQLQSEAGVEYRKLVYR